MFIQKLLTSSESSSDLLVLGGGCRNEVRSVDAQVLRDRLLGLLCASRNIGADEELVGAGSLSAGGLSSHHDLSLLALSDDVDTGDLLTRETRELVVVDVGHVSHLSGKDLGTMSLLKESVMLTNALPDQSRH
jgi:hypothetical protein